MKKFILIMTLLFSSSICATNNQPFAVRAGLGILVALDHATNARDETIKVVVDHVKSLAFLAGVALGKFILQTGSEAVVAGNATLTNTTLFQ